MGYYFADIALPEVLERLGARAKALRLLRNLTQHELGRRSGVGTATIYRFETSGQASLLNALRIAVALGADDGFERLFEAPKYSSLDEALARPAASRRRRASRTR